MKKIYLGAISALLLASCTTIQKVSKTAKDVKQIGETIYDFKPKKVKEKKVKNFWFPLATWDKEFIYDNKDFYEKNTYYFFRSSSEDIYMSKGKSKKKTNLGHGKKFEKHIKSLNKPSKNGNVRLISKLYSNDSLKHHYEVQIKDKKIIDSTYVEIINNF